MPDETLKNDAVQVAGPPVPDAPAPSASASDKLAAVASNLGVAPAPAPVPTPAPFVPAPTLAPAPTTTLKAEATPAQAEPANLAKNAPHTQATPVKHPALSAADKLLKRVIDVPGLVVLDTGNVFRNGLYRFRGVCDKCGWQTHVSAPHDAHNIVAQHLKRHGVRIEPLAPTTAPPATSEAATV